MKLLRLLFAAAGIFFAIILLSWAYTSVELSLARSKGIYSSAELGMQDLIDKAYAADHHVKVLYAGTNSFDGSKPYIWYVIAEVHAARRVDGSSLSNNGCDAPGSFFLETKDGWVHVPEGSLPGFMGFWMSVFDMAGPGQVTPSTNWAPDQPAHFCR